MGIWQSSPQRHVHKRLKNQTPSGVLRKQARRKLRLEPFEERILFSINGPLLLAVIPFEGSVLQNNDTLHVAPHELTFRFDSAIDANSLITAGVPAIQFTRGVDHTLGNGNDLTVQPGYVGIGDNPYEVLVRFDQNLPDDLYRVRIVGAGTAPLKDTGGKAFNNGQNVDIQMKLDLGAQVVAIVPQPVSRDAAGKLSQATNQIEVYFNSNDPLDVASAQAITNYQLIRTATTANPLDDTRFNPTQVQYDAATGKAVLTFDPTVLITAGTYRLRIGNSEPMTMAPVTPVGSGPAGSSFGTANSLGTLFPFVQGTQTVQTSGQIEPTGPVQVLYPGSPDEPGERDGSVESHVAGAGTSGVIPVIAYNFKANLGSVLGEPAFNLITPEQKKRVREVMSYYAHYLGVEFVETPDSGYTIATGDVRVINPNAPPTGIGGMAGAGLAIMNSLSDWGASEAGGGYFSTAMHEIGHLLGLGHNYSAPGTQIMGSGGGEPVAPGDFDILYGRYLWPTVGNDINVQKFTLPRNGQLNIETIAERLGQLGLAANPSQLDSVITVYDAAGNIIARNDDYYGKDSFVTLNLAAGTYYVAITSTGNTQFDPTVEDSGFGGTTQGSYQLRMTFTPTVSDGIRDATGTLLDGDTDGVAGGVNNFWFKTDVSHTLFVDKAAGVGTGTPGSITNPYKSIADALAAATPGNLVRIVGNGGADKNVGTVADNLSYNVGFDSAGISLSDGSKFEIPRGVTVMIDAGAIIKFRGANIDVGSSSQGIDRSAGALQVLGTSAKNASGQDIGTVYLTSYYNNEIGTDAGTKKNPRSKGDWGGIVMRDDSDLESAGVFLNYVNHANLSYGGGQAGADPVTSPIHVVTARPTLTFNTITHNADSAVSADPNSFEETEFQGIGYLADYTRVGPRIYGNTLTDNTINGLFIRIRTQNNSPIDKLTVNARFDDTDIVHVLNEVLLINGVAGGMTTVDGVLTARPSARLAVDPGIVMKLGGARIETEIGAQFIAEGTVDLPIIFTSIFDDRYGAGGNSDTTNDGLTVLPNRGNWGGFFFGPLSIGSIDHALVAFGGGTTSVEGGFDKFDAVEIHQAQVRITNTVFDANDAVGGGARNGRSTSDGSVIFIRGAQPVILNNTIQNSTGYAISINVNSLNSDQVDDTGRSRGPIDLLGYYPTNNGPLIRKNLIGNNAINGMLVRGGTITTNVIFDDTDIVHVVGSTITATNQQSLSGTLRLESSSTESLVVKLINVTTDIVATGNPTEVSDRLGGSVQVIGQPNYPVILTSLKDDTVGAGLTPQGQSQKDTRNTKGVVPPAPAALATSGPVIIDSAQRDKHGTFFNNRTSGGWRTIEHELEYVTKYSTVAVPAGRENTILAIGEHDLPAPLGRPYSQEAIEAAAIRLGITVEWADERNIGGVNFANYKAVFIPSHSSTTMPFPREPQFEETKLFGGITDSILDGLTRRKGDLLNYVNNQGGGLLALSQLGADKPYSWLADPVGVGFKDIIERSGGNILTETALVPPEFATVAADGFVLLDDEWFNTGSPYLYNFKDINAFNRLQPWAVDPVTGEIGVLGLAPGGVGIGPPQDVAKPANWGGIKLNSLSNDTNFELINEIEQAFSATGDTNQVPGKAQLLGEIAKNQLSGDDNVRLGFEVHGALSQAANSPGGGDVDVYKFRGTAGTSVWFDIDRTASSLDSVVELVDANGAVIARSDNSLAESVDSSLLVGSARPMAVGSQNGSPFASRDFYSTNPKDAGMRVSLPGAAGSVNDYYVRVRSSSQNLASLTGGLTKGAYVLQLRLQEEDQFPGSTVRYSDIRYANNGIEVIGKPEHSPLIAGASEPATTSGLVNNNSFLTAQDLGNLLTSDRNSVTVSGNLATQTEVDWYKFNLNYAQIQSIGGLSDGLKSFAAMLQINYADGLVRPDTTLSMYDSNGTLLLVARDSQLVDSLPRPNTGSDSTNLAHGSFGVLDPSAGPVQLPAGAPPVFDPITGEQTNAGATYYVAVSSAKQLPQALTATVTGVGTNPLIRLEPMDSVTRIVDDRIGFSGSGITTAGTSGQIFPGNSAAALNSNADAYQFGDVVLFVQQHNGNQSDAMKTVNPFTGAAMTNIPSLQIPPTNNSADRASGYYDIAMRNDGRLFSLSQGPSANGAGNYVQFNTASGQITNLTDEGVRDDDVKTSRKSNEVLVPVGNPPVLTRFTTYEETGLGIQYEAMAFLQSPNSTTRRLFAIGNRAPNDDGSNDTVNPPLSAVQDLTNLLFELDPDTGQALHQANPVWSSSGARSSGTNYIPLGALGNNIAGKVTGMAIVGSDMFVVDDQGNLFKIVDWDDPVKTDLSLASAQFVATIPGASFTGLTVGPQNVEGGIYKNMLFGIDVNGVLRAMDTNGVLQPIFKNGATTLNTGVTNAQGLAFSTLDYNLWHATDTRATDPGHGISEVATDNVARQFGNTPSQQLFGTASFYFGLEGPKAPESLRNNQPGAAAYVSNPDILKSYGLPGGAYGTLTSKTFSLEGYNATDSPTLYFNYFLDTLNNDNINVTNDAFRVLVSTDGVNWESLATSNVVLGSGSAENPAVLSPSGGTYRGLDAKQKVQGLFESEIDDPNSEDPAVTIDVWRQARVDLGDYAGKANLRLRFEFSTAGTMGSGQANAGTGVSIKALPGASLKDGDTFTVGGQVFRFSIGFSLVAPNGGGAAIADGETFTINGQTFEFNKIGGVSGANTAIPITNQQTPEEVAAAIKGVLNNSFNARLVGTRVELSGATTLTQSATHAMSLQGQPLASGDSIVQIDGSMTSAQVANLMAVAIDKVFSPNDSPTVFTSSKLDGDTLRMFGFTVSSSVLAVSTGTLPGDNYGNFNSTSRDRSSRTADQGIFEGVYIDDIIVGFASRGELVSNAKPADTAFATLPTIPNAPTQILSGAYQLQIRPAESYGASASGKDGGLELTKTFDVNDRLARGITLVANAASQIYDGEQFTIDDGTTPLVFEFDTNGSLLNANHVQVSVAANATAAQVAAAIRNAINQAVVDRGFKVRASTATGGARVDLFNAFDAFGSGVSVLVFRSFGDTRAGFNSDGSAEAPGQTLIQGNKITNSNLVGIKVTPDIGPILDTDADFTQLSSFPVGRPGFAGSVATLPTPNTQGWVPGVTLTNNLVVNSGRTAIEVGGSPNTNKSYSLFGFDLGSPYYNDIGHFLPFVRVVNNTVYNAPLGIASVDGASPTIINNIIAKTGVAKTILISFQASAVLADGSSGTTVVGNNLYQNNLFNAVGAGDSNVILLQPTDPLFVDAAKGNFYLAAGSQAIDSSVNSVQDRGALSAITGVLGIPPSPIQAPATDLLGQLRVDDPAVPSPPGLGSNVFKDRGALERSDFNRPTAVLLNPVDNDANGNDRNLSANQVLIVGQLLTDFTLQLVDGVGVGLDDSTVDVSKIIITRTVGTTVTTLTPGFDYVLAYDTNSKVARVIPTAGVWSNAIYTVTLKNSGTDGIRDLAGNFLQANTGQLTQFIIQLSDTITSPWQNKPNRFDVNNSGTVSGQDVLIIINRLLDGFAGPLPIVSTAPPYYDVNGDGRLSPSDVLAVINYILDGRPPITSALVATDATPEATPAAVADSTSLDTTPVAVALAMRQSGSEESATDGSSTPLANSSSSSSAAAAIQSPSAVAAAWADANPLGTIASEETDELDPRHDELDSILNDLLPV